jgi:competence protein ComEC
LNNMQPVVVDAPSPHAAAPPAASRRPEQLRLLAPPRPTPIVAAALAFMCGIGCSDLAGPVLPIALAGFALALAALTSFAFALAVRIDWPPLAPSGVLIIAIALLAGLLRHQQTLHLPPDHVAHVVSQQRVLVRLTGRVITEPHVHTPSRRNPFTPRPPAPRTTFILAGESFETLDGPRPVSGLLRVTASGRIEAPAGRMVTLTGWLRSAPAARNPGEPDWRRIFAVQEIHAMLSVDSPDHVTLFGDARGPMDGVRRFRASLRGLFFEPYAGQPDSEAASLLDTLVLGQRNAVAPTVEAAFLRIGAIHFLVASGFQVVVLAGFAAIMLRGIVHLSVVWLSFARDWHVSPRRLTGLATLVTVAVYVLVVDWDAPVLRAIVMAAVASIALLVGRPLTTPNWLALSALALLAGDPAQLFRAGFQLSFLVVLTLCVVGPVIYDAWRTGRAVSRAGTLAAASFERPAETLATWAWGHLRNAAAAAMAVSLLAWLVAAPLVAWHFGQFHPWAAVSCALLTPCLTLAVVLGFATMIGGALAPPLGPLLGALYTAMSGLTLWLVDLLTRLPQAVVDFAPPPAWLPLATYIVLAWYVAHLRSWARRAAGQLERWRRGLPPDVAQQKRRLFRPLATGASAPLALMLAWPAWLLLVPRAAPADAVHVLAVGDGSAAILTAASGSALLCDVGSAADLDAGAIVTTAARHLGLRGFEAVLLTHANYDHYSGLPGVLAAMPAARVLTTQAFLDARLRDASVHRLLGDIAATRTPVRCLTQADDLPLGDGLVEVLWPRHGLPDTWPANDTSLVLRYRAAGARVLLAGDVERRALLELLKDHADERIDLACDVLLAPHHGDDEGDVTRAFLRAACPRYILVSTARPRPAFEAAVRHTLGARVPIYATDRCGAIAVRLLPGGQVHIATARPAPP